MARESDPGNDAEERHPETDRLDPSEESSDSVTPAGDASTADTRADASDWIASFCDVRFTWDQPGRVRELGQWWRTSPDEEVASSVDNSSAFRTGTDDQTRAASGVATATAAAFGDMPTAGPSRKRVASVAAIVGLLVAVAAVGIFAFIGRNGGGKSSSGVATTARSESSTTTGSRAAVTTTIAPAAAPSAPSTSPSTPIAFTVLSTCGGRDCTVAVREGPSTEANKVRSLRTGEVVQVTCSTLGESIKDADTGQQSDIWYRLADTGGYSSAVYLEGPTVPDCG